MKKRIYLILIPCLFLFIACSNESPTEPEETEPYLKEIASYNINVDEPSGLALSIDGKFLWTVSDQTNKVYKISFTGEILETLNYRGNDLEGVVQNPVDSTIWVAEEYISHMIQMDTLGNILDSVKVPGEGGSGGLEGITINLSDDHFFLVKEKDPGVLIELGTRYDLLRYQHIAFAWDFSGISYDSLNQHLWIVSDQNEKVFECDMEGHVIREYEIDVRKPEGIAIDIKNNLVYIVSDSYEKLYQFSIEE